MREPGEISYGDLTFQDSHPGVISAIASITGLTPPAVDNCRVLELGCGTGFNLLAMSVSIPGGRFTGIDYSPAHISRANEAATAIGAKNVEFHCLSIDDFESPPGSFDYIVAHGVYSWVPSATRDAILAIIHRCLSPHGLAYISYNTLPGGHLRSLVRDSLRYFPNRREALDLLTHSFIKPDSAYARALRAEWDDARQTPDYYLVHEYLVPDRDALYFHEFVSHAGRHQLQFAGEPRFFANSFAQSETVQSQLENAGADIIQREQYLDWLVGRYFRQTLLCHAGLPSPGTPGPESILDLNIALNAEKTSAVSDEMYLGVIQQLQRAAVVPAHEIEIAGMPSPFVAAVLWSGWRDDLWTVRTDNPAIGPIPCPLASFQAAAGPDCTNRLHRRVRLTSEERELLLTFDANHPAAARLAALALFITPAPATGSAR